MESRIDPVEMDAAAEKIRAALRELGCAEVADSPLEVGLGECREEER